MSDWINKLDKAKDMVAKGYMSAEEFENLRQQALAELGMSDNVSGKPPFSGPTKIKQQTNTKFGSYHLLEKIGEGGMGQVFRARHTSAKIAERQGGDVAIKRLHSQYAQNQDYRDLFEKGVESVLKLEHPGIIKAHDLVRDGNELGLVMEIAQGKPLSTLIAEMRGPMPWDRAWPLVEKILLAVAHSHHHGVIHRDIKPENIIVSDENEVKVLDFGIAKDLAHGKTKTGIVMGTVKYMAPEQYTDSKRVDQRADIYALGLTLYEMLAGCLPWEGNSSDFDIQKIKDQGLSPYSSDHLKDIPKPLADVIFRAISRQVENRYESISEMLAALNAANQPIKQAAPTPITPPPQPKRPSPPPQKQERTAAKNQTKRPFNTIVLPIAMLAICSMVAVLWFGKTPKKPQPSKTKSTSSLATEQPTRKAPSCPGIDEINRQLNSKEGWKLVPTGKTLVELCQLSEKKCDTAKELLNQHYQSSWTTVCKIAKVTTIDRLQKASFDCKKKQRWDDFAICDDPELRELDGLMGRVYLHNKNQLNKTQQQSYKKAQSRWNKTKRLDCQENSDKARCLYQHTVKRLVTLAAGTNDFQNTKRQKTDVGSIAPSFKLPFLGFQAQGEFDFSTVKGSPIVINFWGPSCLPCESEHSDLLELANLFKPKGVVFLGILYPSQGKGQAQKAKEHLNRRGAGYPTLLDPNEETAMDFGVTGIPETYIIDKNGIIRAKFIGPIQRNKFEIAELLETLL